MKKRKWLIDACFEMYILKVRDQDNNAISRARSLLVCELTNKELKVYMKQVEKWEKENH